MELEIFYDSARRYKRFHLLYKVNKHHHEYLCIIELAILPLDLRLYFMNYDSVFRSMCFQ